MKFCSECGAVIEGKKFCSECGAPVGGAAEIKEAPVAVPKVVNPRERTKSKVRRDNWFAIAIVIFAFLCINAFLNPGGSSHSSSSEAQAAKDMPESEFKSSCLAISYDQLARYPDEREGMPLVITGKVIQVLADGDGGEYRIAVDSNYDQVIYAKYEGSLSNGKILEDDIVTFWGTSDGLLSYHSTLGGKITIPSMIAKYHQIN